MGLAPKHVFVLFVCVSVCQINIVVSQTTLGPTEPEDAQATTISTNPTTDDVPPTTSEAEEDTVDTIPTDPAILATTGPTVEDFTLSEDESVMDQEDTTPTEAGTEEDGTSTASTTTTTEVAVLRTEDFELSSSDPKYAGEYQFQFQEMTNGSIMIKCQISVEGEDFAEEERPVVFFNAGSCSNIESIQELDGFQVAILDKHGQFSLDGMMGKVLLKIIWYFCIFRG